MVDLQTLQEILDSRGSKTIVEEEARRANDRKHFDEAFSKMQLHLTINLAEDRKTFDEEVFALKMQHQQEAQQAFEKITKIPK